MYDQPDHKLQVPDPDAITGAWAWPAASGGQRAAAYVLDVLILGALNALIDTICEKFFGRGIPFLGSFLTTFYFVYFHTTTGQTLGKKILGIKVVLNESMGEFDRPHWRKILRRETLGRIVCVFTLMAGYFVMLVRADRRGWHDAMSGTKVISLNGEVKSVKLIHALGGLVGIGGVLAGVGYYVYFYTPYPIRQYAQKLELLGFTVGKIEGSLKKGVMIERIWRESDGWMLEVKGISFQFDYDTVEGRKAFAIKDFSVESANFNLKRWPEGYKPADLAQIAKFPLSGKRAPPSETVPVAKKKKTSRDDFRIDSLNIANIELQLPDKPLYKIRRFFISDLLAKGEDSSVSVGRVWLDSDMLDLNVQEFSAGSNGLTLAHPLFVKVKPALFPELIKDPIDVTVDANVADKTVKRLTLKSFNNRMRLIWDGEAGELLVSNLTAAHYFKTDLPLWNLNLKIAGRRNTTGFSEMRGDVALRGTPFQLEASYFVHDRAGKRFLLVPKMAKDFKGFMGGAEKAWILTSTQNQSAREVLSELYFSKVFEALSTNEMASVMRDERFFADSPKVGQPAVLPAPVAPIGATPAAPGRAPAKNH